MSNDQSNLASVIDAYVEGLKDSPYMNIPAVERAFRAVQRHLFVRRFFVGDEEKGWTEVVHDPAHPRFDDLETIYSDKALITRLEDNRPTSSTSQPGLVAQMIELLELEPGMRVLEIGAGTGYNAALMAEIVGDPTLVTTIDIQEDVVEDATRNLERAGSRGVRVLCRDGFDGAEKFGPYDRIVATVGCPDISPNWVEQLAPDGALLVPLKHAGANPLVRIQLQDDEIVGRIVGNSGFMAVQGQLDDGRRLPTTPPPEDGEEERDLWQELANGRDSDGQNEPMLSFWFFLGLREPRTRVFHWFTSFGIEDESAGLTARVEEDRLIGDPKLLGELEVIYGEWMALGAPPRERFGVRFVPADSSQAIGKQVWAIPGQYYSHEFFVA